MDRLSQGDIPAPEIVDQTLPDMRPSRLLLIAILSVAPIAAASLLLPSDLGIVVVVTAFIAGVGLERYRQARMPLPPTISETPQAWVRTLSQGVGLAYGLGALALIAAAIAVQGLSFGGDAERQATVAASPAPQAGPRPS